MKLANYKNDIIGWAAFVVVCAGIWGRWGWQPAVIVFGLPLAGFYFWGEYRRSTEI